jgi:hypothetical protein
MDIPGMNDIAITLVHGTFASDAQWIRAASTFCRELENRLNAKIKFFPFVWSGENNHQARVAAGKRLASHSWELREELPHCLHFVIAHSHGGNVACYALRWERARDAIDGIITMGTPFIRCRGRDPFGTTDLLRFVFADISVLIAWLLVGIGGYFLYPYILAVVGPSPLSANIGLIALFWLMSLPVFLYFSPRLIPLIGAMLRRRRTAIIERLRLPELRQTRLLSIGAEGDEAARYLAFVQGLSDLPKFLQRILEPILSFEWEVSWGGFADSMDTMWDRLNSLIWRIMSYGILLVGMIVPFFVGEFLKYKGDPLEYIGALFTFLFFIGLSLLSLSVCTVTIAQLIVLFASPLLRAHRLGFGGESILDNWLANINAVSDPSKVFPGEFACYEYRQLNFSRTINDTGHSLRHSRYYNDNQTIHLIARWLNRRLSR